MNLGQVPAEYLPNVIESFPTDDIATILKVESAVHTTFYDYIRFCKAACVNISGLIARPALKNIAFLWQWLSAFFIKSLVSGDISPGIRPNLSV